ncbi:MAG TPA: delta-60 repeat domain-containing protein [Chloroflexia bacterium]|nr:delta-60 repeat domain-containing protein [Chloroflexia bacterium]
MERNSNGSTRIKRQIVTGPRGFRRKLSQLWLIRALVAALVVGMGVGGGGSPVYAADGDLDPTFDGDGKVTTDFLGHINHAKAVAIQSDGKIVAAGIYYVDFYTSNFFLARYNADGSLDTSFDGNGIQIIGFSNYDHALAVAIQSDGKIVVAGCTASAYNSNTHDFALARLNANGSLDTSFGSDGKVITNFSTLGDCAHAVAIQSNGKIVVAGAAESPTSDYDFALARYNTNGSLDTTFSGDGKVTTDFSGYEDSANGLAIQSNGKIVAGGYAESSGSSGNDFALARYDTNGSLDTTFSGDGKVTTDFSGGMDIAYDAVIQSDGKIVAAGKAHTLTNDYDFALARYNTNGTLDTTFSGDGKVTTDFSDDVEIAYGLAIQANGKIVAAGYAYTTSTGHYLFALTRYTATGVLDTSFGFQGRRTTDFGSTGAGSDGRAVAIQSDGKIVVAGHMFTDTDYDFALARYQAGGGTP